MTWRRGTCAFFSHHTCRNPNAGHFTQVVWKGSTQVGCGAADCTGHSGVLPAYVVCRYAPAGNFDTTAEFKANVLPCGVGTTSTGGCKAISLAGAPSMGHRKLMSSSSFPEDAAEQQA